MWSCSIQAALHVVNGNNERMNDDESALRRASMRMPYLLQCTGTLIVLLRSLPSYTNGLSCRASELCAASSRHADGRSLRQTCRTVHCLLVKKRSCPSPSI